MLSEFLLFSIPAFIIGLIIIRFLDKKVDIRDRVTEAGREKRRILGDPDLLLAKLKEGSDGRVLWDHDDKLNYNVVEKDGKKVLDLQRTPGIRPGSVKDKPQEKKAAVKKKVKKETKKDGGN